MDYSIQIVPLQPSFSSGNKPIIILDNKRSERVYLLDKPLDKEASWSFTVDKKVPIQLFAYKINLKEPLSALTHVLHLLCKHLCYFSELKRIYIFLGDMFGHLNEDKFIWFNVAIVGNLKDTKI